MRNIIPAKRKATIVANTPIIAGNKALTNGLRVQTLLCNTIQQSWTEITFNRRHKDTTIVTNN